MKWAFAMFVSLLGIPSITHQLLKASGVVGSAWLFAEKENEAGAAPLGPVICGSPQEEQKCSLHFQKGAALTKVWAQFRWGTPGQESVPGGEKAVTGEQRQLSREAEVLRVKWLGICGFVFSLQL